MKRVNNADINFVINPSYVNLANFTIKFYTTNEKYFYIEKNQDDVTARERQTGVGGVDYIVKLDWSQLITIGKGVLNCKITNNYEDDDRADGKYNTSIERTSDYYIDSNVTVSEEEAESYAQVVAELGDKIDAEIVRSESADTEQSLALNTEIETRQNQVSIILNLIQDISGNTDMTNYYTKSETSGATEISTALDDKLDVSAYTPTDLSNYYTKSETSGASEISTAFEAKLDVTAYTPTDLTNYYTKSETSGKSEIANALNDKSDKSNTYTKSETSGATEIASALNAKLDTTAYTPTDLNIYYTKSQTSGATEISSALSSKLDSTAYTPTDLTNYYTKSETSGKTEIASALNAKLDVTAYTPTDLTNYYTKSQTSGASEIASALLYKIDTTAIISAITSSSTNSQIVSAKCVYDQLDGLNLQQISQSDYDNLVTYDNSTLYIIV